MANTENIVEEKVAPKILDSRLMMIVITSLLTAIGTGIVFYFNTNFTLAEHTDKINNIEVRLNKVEQNLNDLKTDIATIKLDVGYMKSGVIDIRENQKQMNSDMKDIYNVVVNIKSKQ